MQMENVKMNSLEPTLEKNNVLSMLLRIFRDNLTLYSNTRESTETLLSESKSYVDILVRKATEYLLAFRRKSQ